jgi:hypothetical protein
MLQYFFQMKIFKFKLIGRNLKNKKILVNFIIDEKNRFNFLNF